MSYLENCINLQYKWNQLKKDACLLEHLNKNGGNLEEHIKSVEAYENEVLSTPLLPSQRENLLNQVKSYKGSLPKLEEKGKLRFDQYCPELLSFFLFFCLGSLLTLVGEAYLEKSNAAKEKGLREGFDKKLEEILKSDGYV
jgi:hypothetical protein